MDREPDGLPQLFTWTPNLTAPPKFAQLENKTSLYAYISFTPHVLELSETDRAKPLLLFEGSYDSLHRRGGAGDPAQVQEAELVELNTVLRTHAAP